MAGAEEARREAPPASAAPPALRLAIVGAGWAGLAAAVRATQRGAQVTLFEASRQWGGRARTLDTDAGMHHDNGQHILIGAYTETLALMEQLGVSLPQALQAQALSLRFPDGSGLHTPRFAQHWPAPLDALAGILLARGWSWPDRLGLLRATLSWRWRSFTCPPDWTVERLCTDMPPRVQQEMIEPLCVSALNTPADRASAQVFLRVLRDALMGRAHPGYRPAQMLLPRQDLGALLPGPALAWLQQHGAQMLGGCRVGGLRPAASGQGWTVDHASAGTANSTHFDQVLLACTATEAARLVECALVAMPGTVAPEALRWVRLARELRYEPIATIYATAHSTEVAPSARPAPQPGNAHEPPLWPADTALMALRSSAQHPAQFVFNRSRLLGWPEPPLQVAFVVSAAGTDKAELEQATVAQALQQLGWRLELQQTVVEKRATFACEPGVQRPPAAVAGLSGLWAAGDYVDGPYPATLEGAVRSGQRAVDALMRRL